MTVRAAKAKRPARKGKARDPRKGWYRDRRGRWHQLRKADGWTWDKRRRRMRNAHPERWYRDRAGVWRRRSRRHAASPEGAAPAPAAPPVPVPVPDGLTAHGGEDRVTLGWNAPGPPAERVEVLRSGRPDTGFDVVAGLPARATSWTDADVALDGTYFYALRAVAPGGAASAACPAVGAEVRDRTAPPAPGAVAATGADRAVVLHWARSPDRWLAGYDVFRALDRAGPFVKVGSTGAGSLGWTDKGLTNGVRYAHYVVARDSTGHTSPPSEVVTTVAADSGLPAVPAGVVLAPGEGHVLVSWSAVPDRDLQGYDLLRSASPTGGFTLVAALPAGTTAYEDLDVEDGRSYFYVVRARDTSGNRSAPSPTAFAAPAANLVPSAPRGVRAIAGDGHVTVAWPPGPEGDLAAYEVLHAPAGEGPWTSAGTVPATATGLTLTGLANGTPRHLCVEAVDKAGTRSPRSAPVVVTPLAAGPLPFFAGSFTAAHAERLCRRAGFGPAPGQVEALVAAGRDAAVASFTRPAGPPRLEGPAPTTVLDPRNVYGHDHVAWLDRMARSTHQLQERMTLVLHDWFATSTNGVDSAALMDDQLALLRRHALGNFHTLVREITVDPAMLIWLSGVDNRRGAPNENYARELMELFTLGADRGAYSERDVREAARALTGYKRQYAADGSLAIVFDPNRFDTGPKTIFGRTGAFGAADVVRLCIEHPGHPSYFVEKLWAAFVPGTPSDAVRIALEDVYVRSGYEIRPVVEAILRTPDLLAGPHRLTDPVSVTAAMHRATGQPVQRTGWYARSQEAGQRLLYPPDVSGWDEDGWLGTSTLRGRWQLASYFLDPVKVGGTYSATETPQEALDAALAFWGDPPLGSATRDELLAYAHRAVPATAETTDARRRAFRLSRQNGLRLLVAMSPDLHVT